MKKEQNELTIQLDDSRHFRIYFYEFNEILNLLTENKNKEFSLREIKDRITSLKSWSEESLINNLYLLEKTTILKVIIVQEFPIFKYQFELDLNKIEKFLTIIEGCFKLDSKYIEKNGNLELDEVAMKNEILEIFIEVEVWTKNEYWDLLINHWKTNILASSTIEERKVKLIIERDKQKESYFSDSNVLKFYCVHDLDKLSKDLMNLSYRSKLPKHPDDFLWKFSEPLEILKNALKGRFKQWFQIQTLNYLIESGKKTKLKKLTPKQDIALNKLAEELEKGDKAQLTGIVNYLSSKDTYSTKTYWNLIKDLRLGKIKHPKLTAILKQRNEFIK